MNSSHLLRCGVSATAFGLYLFHEYQDYTRQIDVPDNALKYLPTVETAQKHSKVVLIPKLLSAEEIGSILDWHETASRSLGSAGRTAMNGAAPLRQGAWETSYLSTNDSFRKKFPHTYQKLRDAVLQADSQTDMPLLCQNNGPIQASELQPRCIELHTVQTGGSLPYKFHHDHGSVLTLDLMITDTFEGGTFCTSEADGNLIEHKFHQAGDAVVFVSHKPHCIQPVTKGLRRVLVLEFWLGEPRFCAHRCEQFSGTCHHTLFWCFWRRALANLAADDTSFYK
mmetsp:Transcript_16108/g.24186  ORF Transcript_16108/g.24186 Transcript_16108/m.24186 type:complete len:282 (-) Transcript_16108:255-1100(-)